jgi:cellobiose epimerase
VVLGSTAPLFAFEGVVNALPLTGFRPWLQPFSTMFPQLALLLILVSWIGVFPTRAEAPFAAEARISRQQLQETVLPYWYDTAIDWDRGGYVLCDDARKGKCVPEEKQIVTQARMVWAFSLAHRLGLSVGGRDYLKAAAHGVKFLRERFLDREYGGYFWSVHLDGTPRDLRKRLYGEAFVVYALVEYYRASGDREALKEARALFQVIQERAHDSVHRGWNEHFERNWTPLPAKDPQAIVEVAGYRSANTHLHLMEAFSELFVETRDPAVKAALEESLALNQKYFYPLDPARSAFHFQPDWKPVTDPASAGLSYGHNVEFAWLMVRAEEALGRPPTWPHFHQHVEHALRVGSDSVRGGIYNRGIGNEPATDRDKIWWVQSEMLAALSYGLRNRPEDPRYREALTRLWTWIQQHQTDPKSGIWLDTVTETGAPKASALAHNWKANYHDVRALVIFEQQFRKR